MPLAIRPTGEVNVVTSNPTKAFRTRIVHIRDFPVYDGQTSIAKSVAQHFEYIPDGIILIEEGKVKIVAKTDDLVRQGFDIEQCEHLPDLLCCPGFIDAHIHAGQLDVIASFGEQLLEWLNQYTFPAELKFAELEYAQLHSKRFIDALLSNGVTAAMVFSTRFSHHAESLFEIASQLNMRMIAGRVMMDRNAPAALCDSAESAYQECRTLIKKYHQHKRLGYAVTPRFAGTSTREQLTLAGKLLQEIPDLWMQTHLSENKSEISWTKKLFPEADDYLNTYERFGLVNEKSMFAHCVHLSESEVDRLKQAGSSIAFCPSSNCFLGSGLFPYQQMNEKNIPIALASDVGAGTSLSPFHTMADAYKVCQLNHYALDPKEAWYLTTLGAARALHLDKHIGSLSAGKEADLIFLNPQRSQKVLERIQQCKGIDEELFTYIILGDERVIERSYIHGELQYEQKYKMF